MNLKMANQLHVEPFDDLFALKGTIGQANDEIDHGFKRRLKGLDYGKLTENADPFNGSGVEGIYVVLRRVETRIIEHGLNCPCAFLPPGDDMSKEIGQCEHSPGLRGMSLVLQVKGS